MSKGEKDEFIHNHITADCYGEHEQKSGWHNYLLDKLDFPFTAYLKVESIDQKPNVLHSLKMEVIGFADEYTIDRCDDFIIRAIYGQYIMKFFLSDINDVIESEEAKAAIDLWKYWLDE